LPRRNAASPAKHAYRTGIARYQWARFLLAAVCRLDKALSLRMS
jgi:hypothetical protein